MNKNLKVLTRIVMFAAVNFVVFTYGKIDISLVGGSSTAIHVANAVVVLSAYLLGPVEGGIAGAIGLSIADILNPRYITSAPKTFFLKFMIGFISGSVARKLKLSEKQDKKDIVKTSLISGACGLGFNVIFDPIIGYLYKKYLLGVSAEAASIILTWTAGVTAFNAVICLIISTLLYLALYKPFKNLD